MTRQSSFRTRLEARDLLVGTFVKTPSAIVAEVLGLTDLDVCCLDAEHAPFGRLETDDCIARLRASDMPSLVRVQDDSSTEIRAALDAGATGILVPHVMDAAQAADIVKNAHFGNLGRGYAGSTRAAGFTTKAMPDHLADSRARTTVIAQIEDPGALENIDEIAAVPGINGLFIGRIDLAVALGLAPGEQQIMDLVHEVCAAGLRHDVPVGMFTPAIAEIPMWRAAGASFFLLGSDHSFMLQGAAELVATVRNAS